MVYKGILWEKENTAVFTTWKVTKFISVLCICLALITGCGEADLNEPDSNLDDPEFDLDDLKVREQSFQKP